MEREIKFRGKRIDNGGWVYGYLYQSEKESWITDSRNINLSSHRNFAWFQVIPETVGQFTGLKDINGVEIYEGDVVRFTQEWEIGADRDKIEVVQFQHGGFTPMCRTLGGVYYECQSERYEVIGNVHDNSK